jgi:hypothetical protein
VGAAGEAGDAAAARDQYAELVPVIERVLGAEHRSRPRLLDTPRRRVKPVRRGHAECSALMASRLAWRSVIEESLPK